MNFGIMAMQLNELVPPSMEPDQPNNHIAEFNHADLVRKLASYGFRWIELGGDLALFFPQAYNSSTIDQLKLVKANLSISYTIHLPLWSIELSTPQINVRTGSVQAVTNMINVTKDLEPEVYVLHATGALAAEFSHIELPETIRNLLLQQFVAYASESIKTILAETGIDSRKLAIETIEFPFDLTMELVEKHNISICLDTGHILVGFSGDIGLYDALDYCMPRLAEIHLHDGPLHKNSHNVGYGLDHQALGMGDLDVKRFFKVLDGGGYSGPIIFELSVHEAQSSIKLIQKIRNSIG